MQRRTVANVESEQRSQRSASGPERGKTTRLVPPISKLERQFGVQVERHPGRAMTRPVDTSRTWRLPFATDARLRHRFMVTDQALPGNLRWGRLLEVLDHLAEQTALAYARQEAPEARVVTAAVDDIVLHTPGDLNQDLTLLARINYVGRTSMEVGICVEQAGVGARPLASCYFTMVARIQAGGVLRNLPLPPLQYVDKTEELRRDAAIQRREVYRQQLKAATQPPSLEEFRMLQALHTTQEQPEFDGVLLKDLVHTSWNRVYPEHENVPQKVFGGYVIRQAFELALSHAEEIASHRPVVVRVNRINFLQPVRMGDKLRFVSRIVFTGQSSVSVEVGIERRSMDRVTRALSNTCVFTFVNVDERMRPQPVPAVYPTTYAEDARYLEAYRRRRQLHSSTP